jgi:hypothetical protein
VGISHLYKDLTINGGFEQTHANENVSGECGLEQEHDFLWPMWYAYFGKSGP